MIGPTTALLAGGLALACAGVAVRLRRGAYRRDDEQALPHAPWWAVLLAAVGGGLVGLLLPASRDAVPVVWLALVGLAAAWIDIDVQRVPNRLNTVALVGMLAVVGSLAVLSGDWVRFGVAGLLALGVSASFAILGIIAGMGMGDVKLSPSIGLVLSWFGPWATVRGLFAIVVLAGLVAAVLLAGGRARSQHMPYAPAMVVGCLAAVLATCAA